MGMNDRIRPKPLLNALADGSAGAVTRLFVSLIVGLLLVSAASCLSYVLSAAFPPSYYRGSPGVRISDEIAVTIFLLGALAYVLLLFRIWSRHGRSRAIWLGVVNTVVIWVVVILLCILVDAAFSGDEEFLITAVITGGIATTLAAWLRLYRRHAGGRPLHDESGIIDLRCPGCDYRMVGLNEARCPECGQQYTLDELVRKQDFDLLRQRRATPLPPVEHISAPEK
jgi:hypothetical protein